MRIACVGGGPAGLVFAISMKLRDSRHDIVVFERNDPGDTFGWGVVFSDQTMENLRANDPKSANEIEAGFALSLILSLRFAGEEEIGAAPFSLLSPERAAPRGRGSGEGPRTSADLPMGTSRQAPPFAAASHSEPTPCAISSR